MFKTPIEAAHEQTIAKLELENKNLRLHFSPQCAAIPGADLQHNITVLDLPELRVPLLGRVEMDKDHTHGYRVIGTAGNYADKNLQLSYYGDPLVL